MKPLIWVSPGDFKNRHIMSYNWRERKTDSVIFMGGKRLPCEDDGGIKYSTDPKRYDLIFSSEVLPERFEQFDCLPNNASGMAPLVNRKALDILRELCPDDIQAFPVTIVPEPGSKHEFENHSYWLINIVKLVDAIDLEKSEVEFFDYDGVRDRIRDFKRITFLNLEDFPVLARISNVHSLKVVSPSLVQAFREEGITGARFVEDKDYR